MKIKPEHYSKIALDCQSFIASNPTMAQAYKDAGLSAKRFQWDVARKAGLIGFFCDTIYKYADRHTHTRTADRRTLSREHTIPQGLCV